MDHDNKIDYGASITIKGSDILFPKPVQFTSNTVSPKFKTPTPEPVQFTGYAKAPVNAPHCHQVSPNVTDPPVTLAASVTDIATSIDTEICKQVDNRIRAIMEEGGKTEWIAWFQAEVEHWKQRCEELEIELECMINAFPDNDNDVFPKKRGNFKS